MADIKLIPNIKEEAYEFIKNDIAKSLKEGDIVIVDREPVKMVLDKFSKECKQIHYFPRREKLYDGIKRLKPTVVVMFFNTERTISDLKSMVPDAMVYMLKTDEEQMKENKAVEKFELEMLDLNPAPQGV